MTIKTSSFHLGQQLMFEDNYTLSLVKFILTNLCRILYFCKHFSRFLGPKGPHFFLKGRLFQTSSAGLESMFYSCCSSQTHLNFQHGLFNTMLFKLPQLFQNSSKKIDPSQTWTLHFNFHYVFHNHRNSESCTSSKSIWLCTIFPTS